jgi:hypothetical protein
VPGLLQTLRSTLRSERLALLDEFIHVWLCCACLVAVLHLVALLLLGSCNLAAQSLTTD